MLFFPKSCFYSMLFHWGFIRSNETRLRKFPDWGILHKDLTVWLGGARPPPISPIMSSTHSFLMNSFLTKLIRPSYCKHFFSHFLSSGIWTPPPPPSQDNESSVPPLSHCSIVGVPQTWLADSKGQFQVTIQNYLL
jgi:hypothetical protein